MGVSELRRLKMLEEENRKLKQLVADLTLDKHILQEVVKKRSKGQAGASSCGADPDWVQLERSAQL